MSPSLPMEIRKLGFNTEARVGDRRLHVQTEVLRNPEVTIRTTVLETGTVRFSESHPCPLELDDVAPVKEAVESQHLRIVGRVHRGEVG